jgi:hypothetical protein
MATTRDDERDLLAFKKRRNLCEPCHLDDCNSDPDDILCVCFCHGDARDERDAERVEFLSETDPGDPPSPKEDPAGWGYTAGFLRSWREVSLETMLRDWEARRAARREFLAPDALDGLRAEREA